MLTLQYVFQHQMVETGKCPICHTTMLIPTLQQYKKSQAAIKAAKTRKANFEKRFQQMLQEES